MDFGFYLPCYWPDTSYPMEKMYREMSEQAAFAEDRGYVSFTVPEHHFTNALVHPSALLTAVHVAAKTRRVPVITATTVLPFHNVPVLAGEIAQADCLTGGRIQVGVGRGAYRYEFDRLQIPIEEGPERFADSLELLMKLLSERDVDWDSKFYKLPATTITPRPVQSPYPKIWFAATSPGGIEYAAGRGFDVMTTPLRESFDTVVAQAQAFQRGREKADSCGIGTQLSMLIMLFVTDRQEQKDRMLEHALGRHRRFTNVFGGPGEVTAGEIKPYDVDMSLADIERNLIIGPAEQCVERLKEYEALGIDNMQLNMSFGGSHRDIMESLDTFATKVMPEFDSDSAA